MKRKLLDIRAVILCAMPLFFCFEGCSKKIKVSVLPPTEEIKETVVEEAPAAIIPQIDSMALLESLIRQVLQNVYFDFDRYNLKPEAIDQLSAVGRMLMEHGTVSILIEGHCDERGSSEYNMGLGENRAREAKKWIVAYGIDDSRIQTTSFGKERSAIVGCVDEECHQKNRRCELKAISF